MTISFENLYKYPIILVLRLITMKHENLSFLLFILLLPFLIKVGGEKTKDPFYLIAHMANNRASLDWAVSNGANAIENDLQFSNDGEPTIFEHGSPCDCVCAFTSGNICNEALGGQCEGPTASDNAAGHMQHVARLESIALYFIDSKVDAKWGDRLIKAGAAVIPFTDRNLFDYGYKGKVVIGTGKINTYDYIEAAVIAANKSSNRERYFFTFDQEGDNYYGVIAMLSRLTNNRVYGTGISSCSPGTFYTGIKDGVAGKILRENGITYIWSIDKESSMRDYINLGVQAIMTNRVDLAKQVINSIGLKIAKPFDSIPVSTTSLSSPDKCDCDYHKGGCTISWPAPSGKACKCKYKGFWTCGGSLVSCNISHPKCASPDESKEACQLGKGDCGGY
jgi:glycerophosphoryl diester phosphodiesterase